MKIYVREVDMVGRVKFVGPGNGLHGVLCQKPSLEFIPVLFLLHVP